MTFPFTVMPELFLLLAGLLLIALLAILLLVRALSRAYKKNNVLFETEQMTLRASEVAVAKTQQYGHYLQELKERNDALQAKLDIGQKNFTAITNQYTKIKTTLEQKELHFAEQLQLFNNHQQQLTLEFKTIAQQIFEEKGKTFSAQSNQALTALLMPFREQIEHFRQKAERIHYEETLQKAQLHEELKQLKALNAQMSQETHELTTALTGNKKMQGNWGELILENILARAGLVKGRDYLTQKALTSAQGDKQIPDVIINLPDNKHIIVDAKVSLNAYMRAVNSTDEDLYTAELTRHREALSWHIHSLSERHYAKASGTNTPEVVILFVPIEAAFIAAFQSDETLFQTAIEQNILVATPTTLLTSLNIVRQLWRLEKQTQSTLKLAELAAKVYDKLRGFVGSMEEIEKSLDKAHEAYRLARNQLVDGRGNLIKLSDEFLELGVAVKAEIGDKIRERGQLELETAADTHPSNTE